nr:MAG TPA: hypothetical protein [Caudoviricetes sp.]
MLLFLLLHLLNCYIVFHLSTLSFLLALLVKSYSITHCVRNYVLKKSN